MVDEAWVQSLFDEEPEEYGPKLRPVGGGPAGKKAAGVGTGRTQADADRWHEGLSVRTENPLGSPPLDWWNVSEEEVRRRLILSMCPERVCRTCGEPSRRVLSKPEYVAARQAFTEGTMPGKGFRDAGEVRGLSGTKAPAWKVQETTGWTDCGHNDWRPGVVLDPFA